MLYLVDTSVWIELFRARDPLDLEAVVSLDEVVTCWPVIQEVLQGFDDSFAFQRARDAMTSFPIVEDPMSAAVFEHAVALYRSGRRNAYTIRSSVDCLIASCALRNDVTVLHKDRDYEMLARVSPLRQVRWSEP